MFGVEHIFEHLLGQYFLPWLKLKQSSKRCSHRHFSKYLQNNSRTHSNHHKNYAKTLFCSRILHLHFQSHSLCESPSNEANCRNGVFLTFIWIPGRTSPVEVWLNKTANIKSPPIFRQELVFLQKSFSFEVIFVHTCIDVNSCVRYTS